MDTCFPLILCVCCLLVLSVNRLDAFKYGFKTVGGSAPDGFTIGTRQAFAFGGFGMDAMCAMCIRIGNYQCYLRYCAGARGSFGGGFAGRGGIPQLAPFIPWNPTCAMCLTDSCRRLWCASGIVGGRIGTINGIDGEFRPSTDYRGYGANSMENGYLNALSISTNRKYLNYGKIY